MLKLKKVMTSLSFLLGGKDVIFFLKEIFSKCYCVFAMPENTSEEKEMTLDEKVIQYFVDLFKHQKGLRRRAGSEIEFLESSRFNPKIKTYKVNVNARDSWKSRRVTVGPIGENTGSKSTCFYAIYDNKLVLKVSPSPVTDFETYIQNIQKERQIVNKLAPRECIIPEVSVVLKKIRASVADESANEQEREAACAQWLRENPEYQEFFKIDGGFIYVMDLSRYVFLSDAVSLFHGVENNIAEEIIRDPSVIDDFDKFEGRYGLENAQIGMDLKSVYTEFEDQLRTLMIRSGASSSMLLYKTQEWFTTYVAGRKIKKDNKELTEDFVKQLNALLNKTVTENQAVIDEYRRMIGDYLHHSSFARHRAHMEGIVSNTLELLAWLRKKGVAIRDIKPDNLLVAGDPERYPNFLSTPASYQIGLIDVETAVDFAPADGKLMQPQLGGT